MTQLLSLDLGTSSIKVLVVDETGQIVGRGSAEYSIHHPQPNQAEQDPEAWWQAAVKAVRRAMAEEGALPASIAAIGLSGQMHGTVLVGAEDRLLAPAIIWPDRRSQKQVQEITERIGAERLIEIAGSAVATGFQAATVRWFQQKEPDLWSQVRIILLPKGYLGWRLTGRYATDPSDGSGTLLFDVNKRNWSSEILKALDIDPARLPPVLDSTTTAGDLQPSAAEALGLPAGIPVIAGAADTACGTLGAGIVNAGTLLITISTGGQLVLPATEVQVDRQGRSHTFCGALPPGPDQAGWYTMGATLSAGMALRWLRDQVLGLSGDEGYAQMMAWAERTPPGADGLLFLPYLVGERTPHMDSQARGLFLGLGYNHGRAELVRAVMEGVALSCFDAYQVLTELGAEPQGIVMAGGGARSLLWRQIVADVFNLPVRGLKAVEQSALGAALLAGSSAGLFEPALTAEDWADYDTPLEPDSNCHAYYDSLLELFRNAYKKHQLDFRRLQILSPTVHKIRSS